MAKYSEEDKKQYLRVCRQLREVRANLTDANKGKFIALSIRAHSMRAGVPKSWYSMAKK